MRSSTEGENYSSGEFRLNRLQRTREDVDPESWNQVDRSSFAVRLAASNFEQINSQEFTYRVVGTKADDSREIIDDGLARQRACLLWEGLVGSGRFPTVIIEPERKQPDG